MKDEVRTQDAVMSYGLYLTKLPCVGKHDWQGTTGTLDDELAQDNKHNEDKLESKQSR